MGTAWMNRLGTLLNKALPIKGMSRAPARRRLGYERLEERAMNAVGTGYRVVLDPGHGGSNIGTAGIESRVAEKTLTLDMAARVERILKSYDFAVELTRRGDYDPSFYDRTTLGNTFHADFFLSIHFNGYSQSGQRGTEALVMATNVNLNDDYSFGDSLTRWTTQSFVAPQNRGVRVTDTRTGVLMDERLGNTAQNHPVVSALLEVESISSNRDVDRYFNIGPNVAANRDRVARNIAQAIVESTQTILPPRDTENPRVYYAYVSPSPVTAGQAATIGWAASDNQRVDHVGLYLYRNGQPFDLRPYGGVDNSPSAAAQTLSNVGYFTWQVPGSLPIGDGYEFKVVAWDAAGNRAFALTSRFQVLASAVGTPSLSVSAVSSSQLNLNWSNVANEDGYYIYLRDNSQTFLIATVGRDTTSYLMSGLAPNTSYVFYVMAFNAVSSASSNIQWGTTLAAQLSSPGTLYSWFSAANVMEFAWSDSNIETSYTLLEWLNGSWRPIQYLSANVTRTSITNPSRGTHFYLVVATYGSQNAYSNNYVTMYVP